MEKEKEDRGTDFPKNIIQNIIKIETEIERGTGIGTESEIGIGTGKETEHRQTYGSTASALCFPLFLQSFP